MYKLVISMSKSQALVYTFLNIYLNFCESSIHAKKHIPVFKLIYFSHRCFFKLIEHSFAYTHNEIYRFYKLTNLCCKFVQTNLYRGTSYALRISIICPMNSQKLSWSPQKTNVVVRSLEFIPWSKHLNSSRWWWLYEQAILVLSQDICEVLCSLKWVYFRFLWQYRLK